MRKHFIACTAGQSMVVHVMQTNPKSASKESTKKKKKCAFKEQINMSEINNYTYVKKKYSIYSTI